MKCRREETVEMATKIILKAHATIETEWEMENQYCYPTYSMRFVETTKTNRLISKNENKNIKYKTSIASSFCRLIYRV